MDSHNIKRLLEELAQEEIPQDMNLLPNFTFVPAPRRAQKARALAKIAILVLLMLLAAVVGYALYQGVTGDPGLTAVEQSDRVTRFDQTMSVTGYPAAEDHAAQVTLDYAYADANRVTVAYTVTGTGDEPFALYMNPTLKRADGSQFLRFLLGDYGTPVTGEDADGRQTYTTRMISSFDGSGITEPLDSLDLVLDVDVASSYPQSDEPMTMLMLGAAHFEFSVPFLPGRVYDTPQTVSDDDVALTLNRVVVTPSLTRIEMCYLDPAPDGRAWALDGQLQIDGSVVVENIQLNETGPNGESLDEAEPCHTLIIPAALDTQTGEWTLTITNMRLPGSEDPQQVIAQMQEEFGITITRNQWGDYDPMPTDDAGAQALTSVLRGLQERIEGPWVFTFTVPE